LQRIENIELKLSGDYLGNLVKLQVQQEVQDSMNLLQQSGVVKAIEDQLQELQK
jgi:hypothetical protein